MVIAILLVSNRFIIPSLIGQGLVTIALTIGAWNDRKTVLRRKLLYLSLALFAVGLSFTISDFLSSRNFGYGLVVFLVANAVLLRSTRLGEKVHDK